MKVFSLFCHVGQLALVSFNSQAYSEAHNCKGNLQMKLWKNVNEWNQNTNRRKENVQYYDFERKFSKNSKRVI